MVLLEPQVFAYDREHYPDADAICVISSDHPSLTNELLAQLEKNQKVVFKLNSDSDVFEVQKQFRIEKVTSFLSYTDTQAYARDLGVQVNSNPSVQMLEWIELNGHSRNWLESLLAQNRAFCCELNVEHKLESVCALRLKTTKQFGRLEVSSHLNHLEVGGWHLEWSEQQLPNCNTVKNGFAIKFGSKIKLLFG